MMVCSVVEALVVETLLAAQGPLACLLMQSGTARWALLLPEVGFRSKKRYDLNILFRCMFYTLFYKNDDVVAVIQRYNEKNKAFTIGKKNLTFSINDMTLIFALEGGKGTMSLKYTKKPNTPFLRRRFPKATRITGPVLKQTLTKAMKGK
ncbi:hypothetical protein CsSME_00050580 [Camellia sinensis var. sinensis]